ncbi:MAG: class I SAM-dependent methyltransferase [Acidimicrobiales bacterium]
MTASCRNCESPLDQVFVDLGMSPLSNAFLGPDQLQEMEPFYPLRAMVCATCKLVQLPQFESPAEIFSDYIYFSSWSTSWLAHVERFVERATADLGLGPASKVVEVASNDGYLLQYFQKAGVPVLGVEPAANVAAVAVDRGIPTVSAFFGAALADELASEGRANLVVANNVLAHVPDLHDFVEGFRRVLAPGGHLSVEFPHLLRLVEDLQFDTIYHEHFSYLSLLVVEQVFADHDLRVVDVEELPTHGGSLRVWARHDADASVEGEGRRKVLADEVDAGIDRSDTYAGFAERVERRKRDLLSILIGCRDAGLTIAAYGAAAKGNTLLNYCGIGGDLIDFVVDVSTQKQGLFLPGTHLPVLSPAVLRERRPDVVLILPWNIQDEVIESISYVRAWGGRFLVQHPTLALVG